MKLKQTIRRILMEKLYLSVPIRRRIGMKELKEFFNNGVNAAINNYRDSRYTREYSNLNEEQAYDKFENSVIGEMMYYMSFHIDYEILDTVQPNLFDDLKNHYRGRIKKVWKNLNVV